MSTEMPHEHASIQTWHAWLCHGADAQGQHGTRCGDGCDAQPLPERLALYNRPTLPPTPAECWRADIEAGRVSTLGMRVLARERFRDAKCAAMEARSLRQRSHGGRARWWAERAKDALRDALDALAYA